MKRGFGEWLLLVDELMFGYGGLGLYEVPVIPPYRDWFQTGVSPKWAARQALSMDNG